MVFEGLSLQETSWRGLLIITATGELTADTAEELRERLSHPPSEAHRVVLDLRGLVRIDRAGVKALAQANADALEGARELLVVRPSSRLVSWRRPPGTVGPGGPSFVDDLVEAFEPATGMAPERREGGAMQVTDDLGGEGLRIDLDQAGKASVIRLRGELDLAGVERVRDALRRAQEGDEARVTLDIDGLEFIDSEGPLALRMAMGREPRRLTSR